jgi:integrase
LPSRRYQIKLKPHVIGLGSTKAFDLAEARERNHAITQLLADKIDPLQARRDERAQKAAVEATKREPVTFNNVTEEYIRDHQKKWKSAIHGRQWCRSLERLAYPILRDVDVELIDKRMILEVLKQPVDGSTLWLKRAPSASRLRNRIETVIGFAIANGYRNNKDNPAVWKKNLQFALPSPKEIAPKVHYAAVPYDEVPGVMSVLAQRQGVASQALRFLILTATRTNEVTGAIWDEIDLDKKLWTIPKHRMKEKVEHKVPLSDAALALLKGLFTEPNNPYCFIGLNKMHLSAGAMAAAMDRIGRTETVHGFRASFKTWADEQTQEAPHIVEMSARCRMPTVVAT